MGNIPGPARLAKIAEQLPDALFLTDTGQKVVWLNSKARDIFGVNQEDAAGKKISDVTGIEKIAELVKEVLENGEPLPCTYEGATVNVKSQDQRYFFKIAINPLEEKGKQQGTLVQFTDVSRFHEIEKIKSDFVSIVSHEFRTPLTTIIVGVDMLREGMLGDLTPRGKEILEAIGSDCERLTRLIDNLMELSRIESGSIYVEPESADAAVLVHDAVRPLKIQAERQGVELVVDLPPEIPLVTADYNKATWVLTNIIGNALRYTPEGGNITIKVRQYRNRVFFSVSDTGCGIPKEDQEKIFRKYIQVRKPGQAVGGAGLGLTIAKDIVMAHGGEIWVESEEGVGTTFTFTFPIYRKEETTNCN